MTYIMLPDLQVVIYFVCSVIKSFKKVFMCRLTVGYIIIYCITIISNALNKVDSYMELKVVESWLT